MGKRLSQLNQVDKIEKEDYLLIDGEQYLESKKIKLKDIRLEDFNTENFYNKNQMDDKFIVKEEGKGLSSNDFSDKDKEKLENTQEQLISGENIKTINGQSILGKGNLNTSGGGSGGTIIVDQTFDPDSENAQSGKAVAEAVENNVISTDTRTPLKKFIDQYKLTERGYVDLTTLSNTKYYYDDFLKAVEDINSNSYLQSVNAATGTTCQIILINIGNQNTVALLYTTSDITITSEFNFQKSVIWDLNGHTVTFTGSGILGNKDVFYQCEVAIYGTKNGSTLKGENIDNGSTNSSTDMITDSFSKLYILGGLYYNNQIQAITDNYISGILKAVSIPDSNHGIYIYNAYFKQNTTVTNTKYAWYMISVTNSKKYDTDSEIKIYNSKFYAYSEEPQTLGCVNVNAKGWILQAVNSEFISDRNPEATPSIDKDSLGVITFVPSYFSNCYFWAYRISVNLHSGQSYMKNCVSYSSHGGVYVGSGCYSAYIKDCEFHYVTAPHGFAAMYVGYGSTAYVDGCTLIGGSNGFAVRAEGAPEGEYTRLFISNSSLESPRVDSGQFVFYGEGISDEIKNATVDGTKIFTEEIYSTFIDNEIQSIVDLKYKPTSRSPQSGLAVKEAIDEAIGNINSILATIVDGGVS